MYVAGVCRSRTAVCNSPNMLYYRTIAHSARERCVLLRDGRPRVRQKADSHSNTAACTCHPWLTTVLLLLMLLLLLLDGRVVVLYATWVNHALCSAAVLDCLLSVCIVCCVQTLKNVRVRTVNTST